jgi:hypothetical protein
MTLSLCEVYYETKINRVSAKSFDSNQNESCLLGLLSLLLLFFRRDHEQFSSSSDNKRVKVSLCWLIAHLSKLLPKVLDVQPGNGLVHCTSLSLAAIKVSCDTRKTARLRDARQTISPETGAIK